MLERPLLRDARLVLALLVGAAGCAPDCVDDGFFSQQNKPSCASTAATATATTTTASTTATTTTTSTTTTTTTAMTTTGQPTTTTAAMSSTSTSTTTGAETCDDGEQNQDESDVDCGGTCDPCDIGEGCNGDDDCATSMCGPDDICQPEHCGDGEWTPDVEAHIDCGLDCGATCGLGKPCESDDDCADGSCLGPPDLLRCALSETCADEFFDAGNETDFDCGKGCGASCKEMQTCMTDDDCADGGDCQGGCFFETCGNGMQDGDESDVDCGGSCFSCMAGSQCISNLDCDSKVCFANFCS